MLCLLLYLSTLYPLGRAWWALRRTSLTHAFNWFLVAWAAWGGVAALAAGRPGPVPPLAVYTALCLTGTAAIAVLGARRPGVQAWNFVLAGLLAVYFLPVAEGWGRLRLGWPYTAFLAATLLVGLLNYLPTRLWAAALLLFAGCAVELAALVGEGTRARVELGLYLTALAPWAAFVQLRVSAPPASELDRRWLEFRDRFGLFWGQRAREQFNRSAASRGWPVQLYWQGLRLKPGTGLPDAKAQAEIGATLKAVLKRFGAEDPPKEPPGGTVV